MRLQIEVSRTRLAAMYESMSTRSIAKELGISLPSVYKLIKEAGIELRQTHAKIKLVD